MTTINFFNTFHPSKNNSRQFDLFKYHLKLKLRRSRGKVIASIVVAIVFTFYIFGVFTHLLELDYNSSFVYPLHSPNFRYLIEAAKSDLHSSELAHPLNNFTFSYRYSPVEKCHQRSPHRTSNGQVIPDTPITLLIVVKSAVCNYVLREVIRKTWGNEKRFSDVTIRTVFMLGECRNHVRVDDNDYDDHHHQCATPTENVRPRSPPILLDISANYDLKSALSLSWLPRNTSTTSTKSNTDTNSHSTTIDSDQQLDCHALIDAEYRQYGDLVQAEFIDSYYNNTLKTMSSLHWTVKHCSNVPFMLFVDDDYYVSVKNLLKFARGFLRKLSSQPRAPPLGGGGASTEEQDAEMDGVETDTDSVEWNDSHSRVRFDGRLYTGYVFPHSRPMRHLISKWYISLADYPYSHYPPYVTGGCFLVNNRTVTDLYYASLYTKRFKYDDVYLGILAKKMEMRLIHNDDIYFDKLNVHSYPERYESVIASHGYDDPMELYAVWQAQRSAGNA